MPAPRNLAGPLGGGISRPPAADLGVEAVCPGLDRRPKRTPAAGDQEPLLSFWLRARVCGVCACVCVRGLWPTVGTDSFLAPNPPPHSRVPCLQMNFTSLASAGTTRALWPEQLGKRAGAGIRRVCLFFFFLSSSSSPSFHSFYPFL